MSEKDINQKIDKLRDQVFENHLEAMTAITRLETQSQHTTDAVEALVSASVAKRKPWYTSGIAKGIGAVLAAVGTGLVLFFKEYMKKN